VRPTDWIPRDGDAILTGEGFVFYTFGYVHPRDRVVSFIKYIPKEFQDYFDVPWLPYEWELEGVRLVRPEKLYSPKIYDSVVNSLRKIIPDAVCFNPYVGKELVTVPRVHIKRVYVPQERLQFLLGKRVHDELERKAVEIITLLSRESGVALEDLGIHGSISLQMHNFQSDIDISVYGSENFWRVKEAFHRLSKKGIVSVLELDEFDRVRRNRGLYKGTRFVINATRKIEEITERFGQYKYEAVKPVEATCLVVGNNESMFRPSIYEVDDCKSERLSEEESPSRVVSMIGQFRDFAGVGEKIRVKGMLEKVQALPSGGVRYRIVVGSGKGEEFLWPLSRASRFPYSQK